MLIVMELIMHWLVLVSAARFISSITIMNCSSMQLIAAPCLFIYSG